MNNLSPVKIILIFFLIGFISYANSINHPFVHDERIFIVSNPYIADLNPKNFFFQTSLSNPSFPLVNTYYRPLLEAFNRVIYKIFGLNPAAYHLMNVLLHILNGILVFYLIEKICFNNNVFIKGRKAFAFSVSLLFLLHPVQTEAVACISGVSNLLFFLLCLMTLYLFISSFSFYADIKDKLSKEEDDPLNGPKKNDEGQKTPKARKNNKQNAVMYLSERHILSSPLLARHINGKQKSMSSPSMLIRKFSHKKYSLSLLVFFLALLSKEQSVILPFLILFYAICFWKKKKDILKDWKIFSGYFIVLFLYLLFRKVIFGNALTSSTIFNQEFILRVLSIPRTLLMYLSIMFFPQGLHYYRCTDIFGSVALPSIILLFIFGVAVFGMLKLQNPDKRMAIFGAGLFILSLGPVLNIVPLVNEYSLLLTSEHFLYMPVLGMIILVLTLINSVFNRHLNQTTFPVRSVTVFIISSFFLVLTIKQNRYWENEVALFERTMKYEKDFGRGRQLLGRAYFLNGQYKKAEMEFKKSLEIMQGYVDKVKHDDVRKFYIGFVETIYIDLAHCSEALSQYKKIYYYYGKVLELDPENFLVYDNMGLNSLKEGDIEKAIKYYEKAFELNNNDLMAANSLAICYTKVGNMDEAEKMLRYVVLKDPNSLSAKENLNKFLSNKK